MAGYIGTTPVPQATQHRESFTATGGQTSFATVGYTPQFIDVYLNGVKLAPADFTATNGSDVVLASGATASDILEIVAYTPFEVASQTFTGDTTANNFAVTGTFTSQGIDDNADAVAITIDSSENVGIGTSSPATKLDVNGSAYIRAGSILGLYNTDNTNQYQIYNGGSSGANIGQLVFTQGGVAERMRIDSSGNVGIGTSSPDEQLHILNSGNPTVRIETSGASNYSSVHFADAGGASGRIEYQHSNDSMQFRTGSSERMRIDSSGNVDLYQGKNLTWRYAAGSTIRGSISIDSADNVTFSNGSSNTERMRITTDKVQFNVDAKVDADNSHDLGSGGARWKDLYLSGGVYLGGTGSANKLDDYEEGNWDPEFTTNGTDFSSVSYDGRTGGTYTKIGRVVHIQMTIISDAITVGSASGDIAISGLPFAMSSGTGGGTDQGIAALSVAYASNWASNPPQAARTLEGTSEIGLYTGIATTAPVVVADAGTGSNDNYVNITGTYITDA